VTRALFHFGWLSSRVRGAEQVSPPRLINNSGIAIRYMKETRASTQQKKQKKEGYVIKEKTGKSVGFV
jgi:hypothetical protein